MFYYIIKILNIYIYEYYYYLLWGQGQGWWHVSCEPPSPGVYFWLYPVFEAVRYGETIYSGIQQIQLDIVRYSYRYQ